MANIVIDARMARHSGIGVYIRAVVPRVARLLPQHRFAVVGNLDDPWFVEIENCTNTRAVECTAPIYSLREQWELPRLVPSSAATFWTPHINVSLAIRKNLIATVHDMFFFSALGRANRARMWIAKRYIAHLRRHAKALLTVSTFSLEEIHREADISPQRVRVTPLGVDDSWFRSPPAKRNLPYFVFVGNLAPHKNLGRLVKGFMRVKADLPHELLIIGATEGFRSVDPSLRQVIASADRVVTFGKVGDAELRSLVAGADALVIPSLYEGFGLPAIEAMAAGTPVLASDRASLPEVCGGSAILFDAMDTAQIAEALRAVALNKRLRAELARRGRAHARSYSWNTTAERTAEVIDQVASTVSNSKRNVPT